MQTRKFAARSLTAMLIVCAPALGGSSLAGAERWASLSGRFLYDGTPPAPVKCNVTKDLEICGKHQPLEESLVVDAQGGLANVLLWVRDGVTDVHPDYAASSQQPVVSDNLHCRFEPHVSTVRTEQPFRVSNSDQVGHNCLGLCRSNPQFNVNLVPGGTKDIVFKKAERLPFKISCAIHPWMGGYVLVQDHPYMATSAADGAFKIANLPAGVPLEIQVWHEKAGYVSQVTKDGKPTEWSRGRLTITLNDGDLDLGDLRVSPDMFSD